VKVKDPKTGEERDETDDERNAREATERTKHGEDDTDLEKLKADRDRWKEQSKKQETRAKENAAAATRLKEIEDNAKSEGQKTDEAKRAAEERAAHAEHELVKLRVAMRKGLTDVQAKRLVGNTEEELEADADELLTSFVKKDDDESGAGVTRRPRAALKPGSGARTAEPAMDVKKIVDEAMAVGR